MNKSDSRCAIVRFCYHSYDNRPNWTLLSSITITNHTPIIGDGDGKTWDLRASMLWDNLSIFRTNCAILMSYIRAGVLAWMLTRCVVKW